MGNKSLRAHKSSSAGGIQALFYGSDMARIVKGLLEELMFGDIVVEIPTYVRNDNSDALYRVDSVNTATSKNGWVDS